jgi:hypothetical protein
LESGKMMKFIILFRGKVVIFRAEIGASKLLTKRRIGSTGLPRSRPGGLAPHRSLRRWPAAAQECALGDRTIINQAWELAGRQPPVVIDQCALLAETAERRAATPEISQSRRWRVGARKSFMP